MADRAARRLALGVAGGSGSGKSTLIGALCASQLGARVTVVECDRYFLGLPGVPLDEHGDGNFDHPASLDVALMVDHLHALRAGSVVDLPTYSFARQSRLPVVERVAPRELIVVDGILSLQDSRLRAAFDASVYVDAPSEERYRRRLARDVRVRGRPREDVERQWQATVVPMYEEYVAPTRAFAAHVIDCRDGRRDEAVGEFLAIARALIA